MGLDWHKANTFIQAPSSGIRVNDIPPVSDPCSVLKPAIPTISPPLTATKENSGLKPSFKTDFRDKGLGKLLGACLQTLSRTIRRLVDTNPF